jgi:hypothetical protein
LLSGEFSSGDTIVVDVDEAGENLIFRPVGQGIPAEEIRPAEVEN